MAPAISPFESFTGLIVSADPRAGANAQQTMMASTFLFMNLLSSIFFRNSR
jgi:hypothetical protein